MVKYLLIPLLLFIVLPCAGQDVQWASKVIDFSSELSPKAYSAQQAIGKPNVLPQGGDNPNAWMPLHPDRRAYIKVWFDDPIRIQQVLIAESYNPSALLQLYAYDTNGNEYLLNTFSPRPVAQRGRLMHFFLEKTNYEVVSLKLVLDGLAVPGYNAIDAVGISSSGEPVEIHVQDAPNVSKTLVTEQLTRHINSKYQEIRPTLTPDGTTLFFSRKYHPENTGGTSDPEDIWISTFDQGIQDWREAVNPGEPLNNKGANYVSSISPDSKSLTLILGNRYQKNDKMQPGVSISMKTGNGWSPPAPIDIQNAFIENNDGHFFLTQNKEVLIMAVERFDTYGGRDIYTSFLLPDGSWSEPMNMGDMINSSSDEEAPFLAADHETLYFSSSGMSGYGGYDIYLSRRLDDTWKNWSEPENLGDLINTSEDEVYFTIPPSGDHAYFSRSNTDYDADIYRVKLPIFFLPGPTALMTGRILDAVSREPVSALIRYETHPEGTNVGFTNSDSISGEYQVVFPLGSNYKYSVMVNGRLLMEDTVQLADQENYREIVRDLLVDPDLLRQASVIAKTTPDHAETEEDVREEIRAPEEVIEINDGVLSIGVHFSFGSDMIWENSYGHLDRIVNLLRNTPVNILLAGHTDSAGNEQYNQLLSERRAKSVYDYLTDKGIDPGKLKIKGYGSSRPLDTNETKEGRRRNRRVDFIREDRLDAYDEKYKD